MEIPENKHESNSNTYTNPVTDTNNDITEKKSNLNFYPFSDSRNNKICIKDKYIEIMKNKDYLLKYSIFYKKYAVFKKWEKYVKLYNEDKYNDVLCIILRNDISSCKHKNTYPDSCQIIFYLDNILGNEYMLVRKMIEYDNNDDNYNYKYSLGYYFNPKKKHPVYQEYCKKNNINSEDILSIIIDLKFKPHVS